MKPPQRDWRVIAWAVLILAALAALTLLVFRTSRATRARPPVTTADPLPAEPMLRETGGALLPFQGDLPAPTGEKQKRPRLSLNGTWKKLRVPGDHALSLLARNPDV